MSRNTAVKDFLVKHRAKLNPSDYGFSPLNRRVSGLRREEVAQLAAVSVSWYTWLEQGREISISPAALQRIGRVLKLSPVEQQYLNTMVFGNDAPHQAPMQLPAEVMAMVDALNPHPAFVRRDNMDILYWNQAAQTQIFDWSAIAEADRNSLKLMFVCPEYKQKIYQWEQAARHTIAAFRAYQAAGNNRDDFSAVIDDLTARSSEFRTMWDYHDVRKIGTGNKAIITDDGRISHYTYTSLEIEHSPGLYLIFYLAAGPTADAG